MSRRPLALRIIASGISCKPSRAYALIGEGDFQALALLAQAGEHKVRSFFVSSVARNLQVRKESEQVGGVNTEVTHAYSSAYGGLLTASMNSDKQHTQGVKENVMRALLLGCVIVSLACRSLTAQITVLKGLISRGQLPDH